MKRIVATFLSLMTFVAFADAQLEIKSVEAKQRDMQSGIVDMTVTLQGDAETVAKCVCRFAATNSETKAAILIEHITRDGDDAGTGNVWTRKFIWDAAVDVGMEKIDDVELTVSVELLHGGVQLWEGGPYWAECNVGATRPEEYGYYFWWGDTVGYWRNADNNGWISVKDSTGFSFSYENCPTCGKDISQLQSAGYIDATGNLVAAHDAATAHLGAPWRMPTDAELSALLNNCDAECTSYNGVSGRLVKGRGAYASKSIFLPAGGYGDDSDINFLGEYGSCWSSTLYSGGSGNAFDVDFDVEGGGFFGWNYSCRYSGRSVRPVRGIVNGVVTTHFGVDFAIKVTAVTAQQRCPRDGLVDITVTIQGKIEDVSKCSFVATNSATGAAIPVEHITQNGEDLGSGTIWTRKFIWDAKADVGTVKIDDVMLSVGAMIINGVQLWENGPYWAECNVGATKPEEYGYYFWWGDTVGYKRNADNNGWVSVRDSTGFSFNSENCPTCGKDNSQLRLAGYIDSTSNLVAAYDAATAHLGVPWRMPTDSEISALISNCDTEWVSRNGVFGRLVKGRDAYATKSIFFPVTGYASGASIYQLGSYGHYFSSTPKSGNPGNALGIFVYSDGLSRGGILRDDGQSVRPVREFAGSVITGDAVTIHLALDCRTEVTWYVNGGTGSDRNSGESSASAKKTIQAAVDAARDGDTILVAAGTYAPFASKNKSVVIQSASGAATTLIDGTDALRPRVEMLDDTDSTFISVNNKTNTVLVGFTVEHCELIIGGTIQRCVIRDIDARAGGAPINFSIVENSLILNNLGCNGGAGDNCIFRNCTIVGNRATSGYRCVALNCVLENCIVYGNADNSSGTWPEWLRPMISDVGYREATVFRDDPLFVDALGGDFRLSKNSSCIDAGDNAYVTSETDLAGKARITNGRVDIGCYEKPVECGLTISYYDGHGGFNFDGTSYENFRQYFSGRLPTLTTNTLDVGETLDFGYHWDGDRISRFHGKYSDSGTDNFYVWMSGSFWAEREGEYEFGFKADDGVCIFVDGQMVVGSKDYSRWTLRTECIQLDAGWHLIEIAYIEWVGPQGLGLYLKQPNERECALFRQTVLSPEKHTCNLSIIGIDGKLSTMIVERGRKVRVAAPEPLMEMDGKKKIIALGSSYTAPVVTDCFDVLVTNDMTVAWDVLSTNFFFEVLEPINGTISAPTNGWKRSGYVCEATAIPEDHYHFTRWVGDIDGAVFDDLHIEMIMDRPRSIGAEFAINTYTVSFELGDKGRFTVESRRKHLQSQTVSAGSGAIEPGVEPFYGWSFDGWDKNFSCVKDNMVVNAVWRDIRLKETIDGVTWIYTVDNGVAKIGNNGENAVLDCAGETVAVPTSLGGHPVVGISAGALDGCNSLAHITIPRHIKSIGDGAFKNCGNLSFVLFEDADCELGRNVFSGCGQLREIQINSDKLLKVSSQSLAGLDGVTICVQSLSAGFPIPVGFASGVSWAGANNVNWSVGPCVESGVAYFVGSIYSNRVGSVVAYPGAGPFGSIYRMTPLANLSKIDIPSTIAGIGVVGIGSDTCDGCESILEIGIPNRVRSIGTGAFRHCENLMSFTVDEDNEDYLAIEGLLYGNSRHFPEGPELICCPQGRENVVLPNGVASVGCQAFQDCKKIIALHFPNSVWAIEERAFEGCVSLEELSFSSPKEHGLRVGRTLFGMDWLVLRDLKLRRIEFASIVPPAIESDALLGVVGVEVEVSVFAEGYPVGLSTWAGAGDVRWNVVGLSSPGIDYFETLDGVITNVAIDYATLPERIEIPEKCLDVVTSSISSNVFKGAFLDWHDDRRFGVERLVSIPKGVTNIGAYAFANCSGLVGVEVQSATCNIDVNAFDRSYNITSIMIPSYLMADGSSYRTLTMEQLFRTRSVYRNITNIVISAGSTRIASRMFAGCENVSSIFLSKEIEEIGMQAFARCGLKSIMVEFGDVNRVRQLLLESGFDVDAVVFEEIMTAKGLKDVFGDASALSQHIKTEQDAEAIGDFLVKCGVKSAGSLTDAQKRWGYESYVLSSITAAPQLFEEEPTLKIEDIELSGGNLSLTISLTVGTEKITLVKERLAEKIRVGSTLGSISEKPDIRAYPSADGTSLTFTIIPPSGSQGFVRVQID